MDIYIHSVNQTAVCTHTGNYLFIRPWDQNTLGRCWRPNSTDSALSNMHEVAQIITKIWSNKLRSLFRRTGGSLNAMDFWLRKFSSTWWYCSTVFILFYNYWFSDDQSYYMWNISLFFQNINQLLDIKTLVHLLFYILKKVDLLFPNLSFLVWKN